MTDYRNLMERCKEVLAWKKTGKTEGDARRNYDKYSLLDFLSGGLQQAEKSTMDDAMMAVVELVALVEKLQSRVAELESRLEVTPVITQHEPVTTVEDRYNADGKSCHITDDLPAGMKLYARPVHAEPVNARLLRLIKKARITIFDGLETPCELEHPASIDDRMLVTEIDSAIADAEAQQAGPVRLTEKDQDNLSIPYVGMGGVENYRAYARAIETAVLRANGFKVRNDRDQHRRKGPHFRNCRTSRRRQRSQIHRGAVHKPPCGCCRAGG